MKSILVPLDGSALGEYALPISKNIARSLNATLNLVHVHTPSLAVRVGDLPIVDDSMDVDSREQEEVYLDALREGLASSGIQVTVTILNGVVADALAHQVCEAEADLVVIATHGRGQLARLWFGSVTDSLIRRTHTPLLVMKNNLRNGQSERDEPFRHILVPLDGSELAEQIIDPALRLGQPMSASYTLIQVVEPAISLNDIATTSNSAATDREATMQLWDMADRYLATIARKLRAEGLHIYTRAVIAQHPAATILEHARRSGADLIAMSTHGRGGISRLILGSVADTIVRNAPMPVLVAHP